MKRPSFFDETHHNLLHHVCKLVDTATIRGRPASGRGVAFLERGFPDTAISDLTKVIGLEPRHVDAYCARSRAYSRLRRHSYAIRDCTQAIVLQPTNAEAYYLRGLARIELNEVDLAITDLEEARRLEPTRADDVAAVINKAVKLDSPQQKSAVASRSESER